MENDNNTGGFHVHVYSSGNNIAQTITQTYYGDVYNGQTPQQQTPKVTNEQIAQALLAINGKDKVINNYQLWLGACCLLMWKYGFPKNLEDCCDYITNLPFGDERPKLECKYESIRKFSYLRFVKLNIDEWDEYQPNDDEKKLFYGCNMVRKELEKEILKLKI